MVSKILLEGLVSLVQRNFSLTDLSNQTRMSTIQQTLEKTAKSHVNFQWKSLRSEEVQIIFLSWKVIQSGPAKSPF